ncbi:DHA2 family efflux MFS transporter permease subunit [Bacillus sp. FJAT-22090]|uniref:DHA2 family efflux MFS transporter permease subunit n=1 Tax=Bacillus sp. FJAT-22090 TaxID=1581038 RepID=UPI00119CA255|nr:DHA2 family efflux MFS transporter permease subunit [Bacillus sp. FJAT-22090]
MAEKQSKPSYGLLAILMTGAFVALLSNTLLNIALPAIMNEFKVSPSTVQWLSTGYMLVNGILIPTTAFLIQKYTARRLFLIAMGLFTVGTIIGGFAPTFSILLAARMIQASGAALIMPLLMNVLYTTFPVEKRGSAMGMFGIVMIFAPAIGPTLSGWIIQHYNWSVLFLMMVPLMVIVWILGFFKLRDTKEKNEKKIDALSVVLSALSFGGILYGFSSAGNNGWSAPSVYLTIIVGVLSLVWLILRQFKLSEPMLDFRVYKYPMFALSSAISITLNMAMFSAMLLMPIYLQNIRGISAMDSGLLMLPGALIMGIMMPITGKIFDKFGPKALAYTGLVIVIVMTYLFSQLTDSTGYTHLVVIYSVRMLGISMVMMPIMTNGLNQISPALIPHGTAMNSTIQQVSGAIGASLLVTIMSNRTTTHVKEMMAEAMSNSATAPTGAALQQLQQHVTMEATISGINDSFLVSTGIAIVSLILALFIKRTTGGKAEAK